MNSEPMIETIGYFLASCVACGIAVWRWCVWLDKRPHPEHVRGAMFVVLLLATALELGLVAAGHLRWWMMWLLLSMNCWGSGDAVLRYPMLHDVDTFFTLKQLLLLPMKICCLALGFKNLAKSKLWFFHILLLNVVTLPLLYFLALPLDATEAEQRLAVHDVVDEDICVRAARFVIGRNRQRCGVTACRKRAHGVALSLARRFRLASWILSRFLPPMASRELRGRSV